MGTARAEPGRTTARRRDARDPTARAPGAPHAPTALLALQRTAGNAAAARLLQRSSLMPTAAEVPVNDDDVPDVRVLDAVTDDAEQQWGADEHAVGGVLARGAGLIRAAMGVVPPGGPAPGNRAKRGRDPARDAELAEDASAEKRQRLPPMRAGGVIPQPPPNPPQPIVVGRVLARATATGDITGAAVPPALTSGPVKAFTPGAVSAGGGPRVKAGGYRYAAPGGPPQYAMTPSETARKAKMVRGGLPAPGTGVGATRPPGWADFLALLGPTGRRKWVQGHFINQRLGGRGDRNNLAPFTYSMNSTHYHSVEKQVIAARAASQVSYTVKAHPNAAGSTNEARAVAWFTASIGTIAGMNAAVGANWLSGADALALTAAGYAPGTPVGASPNGQPATTWGVRQAAIEAWIRTYVQTGFPGGVRCRARYYTGGAGAPSKASVGEAFVDNEP